jgi:peptidoglycan/xylan/chitin deacetylase (PgdA/CDA1 family)
VSDRSRVALTFDAEHPDRPGATPGTADRILHELERAQVRATFFIQSRWARAEPALARRIATDGHLVGNHSTYHARMTLLSDDGIRADVGDAGETLSEIAGVQTRPWFRCPFGDGHDDPRVAGVLEELGYRNVHWDVETEDWEPETSAEDITRTAVNGCAEHGDGAVLLLHTWPEHTADALPSLLDSFGRSGASLVTVDELETLP